MKWPGPACARYYRQTLQPVNGCPLPFIGRDIYSRHAMALDFSANLDLLLRLLYAPSP